MILAEGTADAKALRLDRLRQRLSVAQCGGWSREIALVLGQKGMGARPLRTWRGRIRSFSRFKEEGAGYVDRDMISHIAEDGIL